MDKWCMVSAIRQAELESQRLSTASQAKGRLWFTNMPCLKEDYAQVGGWSNVAA